MPRMDWTPLMPDGSDPVPADVGVLDQIRNRFLRLAADADVAHRHVTMLQKQMTWEGEAANAFNAKVGIQLPKQLDDLRAAFDDAAGAVATFKVAVDTLQQPAQAKLKQASDTINDLAIARAKAAHSTGPEAASYRSQQDQASKQLDLLRAQGSEISKAFTGAQVMLGKLLDGYTRTAPGDFGTWFDTYVWQPVHDALPDISNSLGWISAGAGALAIVTLPIPALSEALGIVSTVTGVLSFVADAALAASGDKRGTSLIGEGALTIGGLIFWRIASRAKNIAEQQQALSELSNNRTVLPDHYAENRGLGTGDAKRLYKRELAVDAKYNKWASTASNVSSNSTSRTGELLNWLLGEDPPWQGQIKRG